jgi:hypothetical protein
MMHQKAIVRTILYILLLMAVIEILEQNDSCFQKNTNEGKVGRESECFKK